MKKIYLTLFTTFALSLPLQATVQAVAVSNNVFTPSNFTINVGDTIAWFWSEGNHTTTSTSVPGGAMTWDEVINQGSPGFMYVVTVQGNYTYQCTFHVAMGMVGQFTAVESSGLQENLPGVDFTIFANPVNRELEVDLKTTHSGMMQLSLNDITGREVKLLAAEQQSAGEHHLRYDVAGLPKGVYMLKLSIASNDIVRKVIVQ
jgi:plastocyanin